MNESQQQNDFSRVEPDFSGTAQVTSIESFLPSEELEKINKGTQTETPNDLTLENEVSSEFTETPNLTVEEGEEKGKTEEEEKVTAEEDKENPPGSSTQEEPPKPNDSTEVNQTSEVYRNVVRKLAEKNGWGDEMVFSTEDGDLSLDEIEFSEEMFLDFLDQQKEQVKEEILKDKVSLEGTSEFTKNLIEIEKNGGDVQQALRTYQEFKNPLDSLDLSKSEDQKRAIALKMSAQNIEEEVIKRTIKSYEADGLLEEKSLESKEQMEAAISNQLNEIKNQAEVRKQERQERIKEYRSKFKDNLSKFEFNDSYKRKLVDLATKETETGDFKLDELYREMRKDPEKAAEVALFLTDKEEYLKQVSKEAFRKKDIETFKKFSFTKKDRTKGGNSNQEPEDSKGKNRNVMDISDIQL